MCVCKAIGYRPIYKRLNIKKTPPSIVVTFVALAKIRCRHLVGGGVVVVVFYSNRIQIVAQTPLLTIN